ncbi:MAG: hypothetical protein GF381_03025 [Candidatus Pacebacteria bacterium]|nr:hypothetical protein [Candidatus Paceibacterota bacterium]
MSKPQTVPASKARNNFSDLLSQVEYQGQEFLIERYGDVVAKLVPIEVKQKQTVGQEIRQSAENDSQVVKESSKKVGREVVKESAREVVGEASEPQPTKSITEQLKELAELTKRAERTYQPDYVQPKEVQENAKDDQVDERVNVIRKKIRLTLE